MKNKMGTGNKIAVKQPSRVMAQFTPRLWNMPVANMGNPAPSQLRKNVFAAIAEFAFTA